MSVTHTGKVSDTHSAKAAGPQEQAAAPAPLSDNGSNSSNGDNDADHLSWLNLIKTKLGIQPEPTLREKLLVELKDDAATKGVFSKQEHDMLNRILHIGSLRVEDVMVPRADIIAIDEQSELTELLKLFKNAGHSRIPVFRDTLDDAQGMIHIKDLLTWLMGNKQGDLKKPANGKNSIEPTELTKFEEHSKDAAPGINLTDISEEAKIHFDRDLSKQIVSSRIKRPVLFVPPSMPAMNLLLRMQSTRIHLALVIDEYGGTDGLVSMEDLIEEVIGEIEDEHDDQNTDLIVEDPVNGLIASARAPVEEFEKLIGIDLLSDEDDEYIDTLGGLVFSLVGRVPVCGELVSHPKGIEFEVLEANSRQIKRLKIHRSKLLLNNAQETKQSDN